MAQGGEWYPQQFALGVLNLYTQLKQRSAELQDMREARSANNLLEQQRIELGEKGLEFQKHNSELQAAEHEAQLKYNYDVLRENRKAVAQDAVTKFGRGEPTFFPMGIPIPPSPTVKDEKGVEQKAFEYFTQDIPGLGTFVIPKNRLTDQYALQDKHEDLVKNKVQMLAALMRGQADQSQAELWHEQARQARTWLNTAGGDPRTVQQTVQNAIRLHGQFVRQLENFMTQDWNSRTFTDRKGKDPRKEFEKSIGEDQMKLWQNVQALINARFNGNPPPDVSHGMATPDDVFKRIDFGDTITNINQSLKEPAIPQESAAASPSGLPSGYSYIDAPVKTNWDWDGLQVDPSEKGIVERNYYDPKGQLVGTELVRFGRNRQPDNVLGTKGTVPGKFKAAQDVPPQGAGARAGAGAGADTAPTVPGMTPEEVERVLMLQAEQAHNKALGVTPNLSAEKATELQTLLDKQALRAR